VEPLSKEQRRHCDTVYIPKIRDSFSQTGDDVYIGKVTYIDYDHEAIENPDILSAFLHKRTSYEHEKELRAIIVKLPRPGPRGLDFSQQTIDNGVLTQIDVPLLVQSVYVAPNAPSWLTSLIRSVVKTYGFDFPLIASPLLNAEPQF